jgi:uncharacterized membrane protein
VSLALLVLVQWLHIVTGIAWFGGYIFIDFVLWPALLRQPPAAAQATFNAMAPYISRLMAVSGALVVLLGVIRGTVLGPIKSLDYLFTTPYGITWLVALLLAVVLTSWGASHEHVLGSIWESERVRPGAAGRLRASAAFELACFGALLACMVLMGAGL